MIIMSRREQELGKSSTITSTHRVERRQATADADTGAGDDGELCANDAIQNLRISRASKLMQA